MNSTVANVTTYLDVPYGSAPLQQYDLYLPTVESAPAPLLVMFHAGGWIGGDKRLAGATIVQTHTRDVALSAGWAVALCNYRLAPISPWPAAVLDAQQALRHLNEMGEAVGLDRDRIVVWGESAGAQIAASVAVETVREPQIRGVIGSSGLYDFLLEPPGGVIDQRAVPYLGGSISEQMAQARAASPARAAFVRPAALQALLIHGAIDSAVNSRQSFAMAASLGLDRGIVHLVPGGDHGGPTMITTQADAALMLFLQGIAWRSEP